MAWLSGWNRRKQLSLNGGNIAQSPYQMKITIYYGSGTDSAGYIYCNSNCKTDFGDIRFTSSDGTTLLNYWVETYTSSSNAIIWVNVSSIPTGTNSAYIYIYYNNTSATTSSNGTNTFLFFDDCSETATCTIVGYCTSKWTQTDIAGCAGASTYESSGLLTQNVPGTGGTGDAGTTISATGLSVGNNIEYYIKIPTLSYYRGGWSSYRLFLNASGILSYYHPWCALIYRNFPSNGIEIEFGYDGSNNTTNFWLYNISNGAITQVASVAGMVLNNYILKVTYNAPNFIISSSTDGVTWTQRLSWTSAPTYTGTITSMFGGCCDRASKLQYSFFRVRNYISTEPTWSTVSTEQNVILSITAIPVTGATVYLRTPQGVGSYLPQGVTTDTTIYVASGTYDIKLTRAGYQDWYLLNQTYSALQTYNIQATLILLPGSLAIYSTPIGASIYIDGSGTSSGTTVLGGTTLTNISVGSHPIRLSLTGYIDWTGTVTVNTQATTNVNATFAGSAYLTSIPTNSSIYLDGSPTPIGNTPLTITNLTISTSDGTHPTQSHNFTIKLSGYADTSGSFTATAGQTINVPVTFPGSLYITSIPTGAQIYIDDILQQ